MKKFLLFTPLYIFAVWGVRLMGWGTEPLLRRWVELCMGFFLSLVLTNILKTKLYPPEPDSDEPQPEDEDEQDHQSQ